MREFYFRDEEDPNFKDGLMETSSDTEALLSNIKMTLGTSRGDVLGATPFGANLEDLLFETNYTPDAWKEEIYKQLNTFSTISRSYDINVETAKLNNGYHDIGVLDVKVNGKSIIGFAFDGQ